MMIIKTVLSFVLICCMPLAQAGSACKNPEIHLTTSLGAVEIDLSPELPASTLNWLETLVKGPVFNPALISEPAGYYHGLSFNYARAHIEVRINPRQPQAAIQTPLKIGARSLGLHQHKIETADEAHQLWHGELETALKKHRDSRQLSPILKNWQMQYQSTGSSDFLVGTSQLKILEAQGHRFDESLQSVAPKAGTVALMPYSTTHTTPGLSFMLQDMPSRAGKWMVVGSIAQGMDVLQKLSLQKGYTHDRYRDRQRRLLDPVAIRDIRWFCPESSIN